MEISNKTLTILLIGTMLVSAFGTLVSLNRIDNIADFLSLTGAFGGPGASTWGATNITVQSNLEINFSDDEVNFSSGRVRAGATYCQIGTEPSYNTTGCKDFRIPSGGLILENTGNVNVRLNLTNLNYSSSFFRDPTAGYAIKITTPEDNANGQFTKDGPTCTVTTTFNLSQPIAGRGFGNFTGPFYTNLTGDNYPGMNGTGGAVLCTIFNASDTGDIINISFLMHMSSTTPGSPTGGAFDVWTATALS